MEGKDAKIKDLFNKIGIICLLENLNREIHHKVLKVTFYTQKGASKAHF
jgi:hypothetical protein